MSEQKIYVGGAKEISGNFGAFHRISFNKDDLQLLVDNLNEKGWVNVNMNRRREPSQFGQTHSLVIDNWQPNQNNQNNQSNNATQQFQQGQNTQFQQPVNEPPSFSESASMPNFDDINDEEEENLPF